MFNTNPIPLITSTKACIKAVQEIMTFPVVAVDCEGVSLSKEGKLCLVCIFVLLLLLLFVVHNFVHSLTLITDTSCYPKESISFRCAQGRGTLVLRQRIAVPAGE